MTNLVSDGFDGHNLLGTHLLSPNSLDTRAGQGETPDRGTLLSSTVGSPQEHVSGPHPPALLRLCSGRLVPGLLSEGESLALC